MSLAKKCDRCGKLYEHYPIGNRAGAYNAVRLVRRDFNGKLLHERDVNDLCPECMAEFKEFMERNNNG